MIARHSPHVNPADFISFYCLRNWGVMNSKVVSEQIYVHDKVLIVDDRVAIIGSANLNDRSMLGDRDSEVGDHETRTALSLSLTPLSLSSLCLSVSLSLSLCLCLSLSLSSVS
jgi:hypothetical protein